MKLVYLNEKEWVKIMGDNGKKYILVLDLDGVVFNSLKLIDSMVYRIEEKASDWYLQKNNKEIRDLSEELRQLKYERVSITNRRREEIERRIAELERLNDEHFEYKDLVLEEVFDKYKGLIGYSNIYLLKNMFEGVIETIWTIYQSGIFERIIGASHCNVESEANAKIEACGKHLPMMEVIPIPFHIEPFFDPLTGQKLKRERTNKIEYLQKVLGLSDEDLSRVVFVDDTISIINEAMELGVGMCYHKRPFDDINDLLMRAYFNTCSAANEERIKRLHLKR